MTLSNGLVVESVDGSSISYGIQGRGDVTIVFVHCWTRDHEYWKPQIEYFSNKCRVVWLDLAGHGLSSSHREKYTMLSFGEDVAAVVNRVGGKKFVLVGHSMGGVVVLEAAKLLTDKVVGLVGVDIFYTSLEYPRSEKEISGFIEPFEVDFKNASRKLVNSMFTPFVDPVLKRSVIDQMSSSNPKMAVSALSELLNWTLKSAQSSLNQYSRKLRNINAAPTGKESALHEGVLLVPGVGHFIPQVKPDEFNLALDVILSEYPK